MAADTRKRVLITGANRGIGLATARCVVERGATAVLAARSVQRGNAAADALRHDFPSADVEVVELDLGSLDAIRRAAANIAASPAPLHTLINNAGVVNAGKAIRRTVDGFEEEFGINHLGHFLLTLLLLPKLKASAPARVIAVSSIRHIPGKGGVGARFDFENLNGEKSFDPRLTYNNTKLANVWFAYEFERRFGSSGVHALAADPGFVPQTIAEGTTGLARWFYGRALMLIPAARTPAVAGAELASLALNPDVPGGTFWSGGKQMRSSDASYDASQAQRLWQLSEKLTA